MGCYLRTVECVSMTSPSLEWGVRAPLRAVPAAVNDRLTRYFAHATSEFEEIGPEFTQAVSFLREFTLLGGKRVRPMFAWAGVRAGLEGGSGSLSFSVSDATPNRAAEALLTAITALEFIQACALIHDDIIDMSDTRRGNATTHRRFEHTHRDNGWTGCSDHYGKSQAILTGDLALAWADDMLHASGVGAQALQRIRAPWRAMRTEVIAGQILDVAMEANGSESVEDSLKVIEYKTASYTVARPLHLGASLVGAKQDVVESLRAIGQDIGEVFQLRDDQLGVFGDPAVTGKPSGDDLRTGKRTALINIALRDGSPSETSMLRQGLGHVREDHDIDALREVITSTGAFDKVEAMIDQRSSRAIDAIKHAQLGTEITEELIVLTQQLNNRKF